MGNAESQPETKEEDTPPPPPAAPPSRLQVRTMHDLLSDIFNDSRGVRISAPDARWLDAMSPPRLPAPTRSRRARRPQTRRAALDSSAPVKW